LTASSGVRRITARACLRSVSPKAPAVAAGALSPLLPLPPIAPRSCAVGAFGNSRRARCAEPAQGAASAVAAPAKTAASGPSVAASADQTRREVDGLPDRLRLGRLPRSVRSVLAGERTEHRVTPRRAELAPAPEADLAALSPAPGAEIALIAAGRTDHKPGPRSHRPPAAQANIRLVGLPRHSAARDAARR
jgi:hypothetical protein